MSDPSDTVASTSDHKVEMDMDESGSTTIEDPCPVCLSNRVEESGIDGCTHTFCYSCITEWLKVSDCCPLCKAPVTEVRTSKIVDGQPVIKKMADLKAEAEAARIMAQANEVPMTSERDAVNQQIHIRRAEVHKLIADKARSKKTKAMNDLYRKATSALNQLTALKEEMERLPRRDIIGDLRFRDVVYRQDLIWRQISRPATAVRFNCAMACADPEGLMTRLKPFLLRELKIVLEPRILQKNPTDQVLTMILTNIQNYEINNPHFENVLMNTRLFQPSCIRLFAHLLYEFCASGLDLSAFDANSMYSLDPAKGPSGRFIPNMLPVSSRTSDPIYINDNEDEEDEDVIVDGQPNGHRSDSSSSDGITNLYNHRACRVRPSQLINSHRHSNSRNRQLPAFVSSFSLLGQLDSFARQHQFAPIAPSIRKVARAPEVISLEDDSAVRDEPRINSIHPSDMNSWMDPSWLNVTGDGGPSTSRAPIDQTESRSSRSPRGYSNFGPESDREGRDGNSRMRDGRKDEKRIDPSWKTENGKRSESRREKRKAEERHQKKQRMFMDLRVGSRKNDMFYYYDKLHGKEMSLDEMQKVSNDLTLFTARINKLAEELNTKLEEKRASNGNSSGSQDQGDIIDVDEEDEDEDIIHMPDQSAPSSSTFNDTIVIQ